MMKNQELLKELKSLEDPGRVDKVTRYMQADPSQNSYAQGDIFVGIRVPIQRDIVKRWRNRLSWEELRELLISDIHEYRSIALLVLVYKTQRAQLQEGKEEVLSFYKDHLNFVNHWDLVDLSAPTVVGETIWPYLPEFSLLKELSQSKNIWKQRVSLVSTLYFIKRGIFEPTFEISKSLFKVEHPMVQKALGWMLKEVGERDREVAVTFLRNHGKSLSSLALTRAKEKYSSDLKSALKFF